MEPQVVAALLAGLASLVVAIISLASSRGQDHRLKELEKFKANLAQVAVVEKARVDYQYDARRHLYEKFEPAVFQLLDHADYALDRIKNLTNSEVWKFFADGEPEPPNELRRPPMVRPKYEVVSTLYGLYAPLAIVRTMGRGLTQFDLSLESRIEFQYYLATKLYGSFKDDANLASISPRLQYRPSAKDWRILREEEPQIYWWQGLTMGRLESSLDLLVAPTARNGNPGRLLSFGEFETLCVDLYQGSGEEYQRKALAVAANALYQFRARDRPVYWRMLIAQARLYQALLRTRSPSFRVPDGNWDFLFHLEDSGGFEWRDNPGRPLEETLAVTNVYLTEHVVSPWRSLHDALRNHREGSSRDS
ncbi:hypothetical protein [Cellulomonas humilata]|uniref:Uncharacterized protein n=1 Tax=Cellulomonas humilata TaxID=144055 RepID=A0ABU0EF88_9CELL|nr:hypothetical protein [Cellulomonas humilata]MDQ0373932.1 hypothetical protein [Cellulomonas humilata]